MTPRRGISNAMKKMSVFSNGFEQRGLFKRVRMLWRDVNNVYGQSMDKVTYSELFLKICDKSDRIVVVGEFDKNFADFELALKGNVVAFPDDWRATMESRASGDFQELWRRQ